MGKTLYSFVIIVMIYLMQALIREIYGVWRFDRPAGMVGRARSTPGHLIHYVADGGYDLTADNRTTSIEAGDLIYYYESEEIVWRGRDEEVTFYSVGFDAPSLRPPPFGRRHIAARPELEAVFERALELENGPSTTASHLAQFGLLSQIVLCFHDSAADEVEPQQSPWWYIENEVRRRRTFRAALADLGDIAGCSRATVIRECKRSTGMTPMARLRELRLAEARGLLLYSMSSVTDVALQLGYGRIQEFSREFSQHVGMPPGVFREHAGSQVTR
jgi:AraC-like DNA-binding protein